MTMTDHDLNLKIELGDVDGDGKQDVTVYTHNKTARVTLYDVKQSALRIVEIVAAVLAALGIEGMF